MKLDPRETHLLPRLKSRFTADDGGRFAWATRELMKSAEENCQGRLVAVLEGGYDLRGLADSVSAHVGDLMKG